MTGLFYSLVLITAFIYGTCLGSFTTALLWRIPRGLPWITDDRGHAVRSACPSCGVTLGAKDLWPLVSWIRSGGKCRHCGTPISGRYPLIELVCGLIAVATITVTGPLFGPFVCLIGLPFFVTFIYSAVYGQWAPAMLMTALVFAACGWVMSAAGI